MYSFDFKIAGQLIHAETIHTRSRAICHDFYANGDAPVINISITESDISMERKEYENNFDIEETYIFSAASGTGKTTHICKWLRHLPKAFVVNGDKPFLKFKNDGTVLACGSPWAGKENLYTNTMVPLKAIVLMERAEENHIEQISFAEAFPFLLQQIYRPINEEKMRKTLQMLQRLSLAVTFWRFQCNNYKDDCFDVIYNALVRDQK